MNIKIIFSAILLVLASFMFTTCDDIGTIIGTIKGVQTYFQSDGSERSVRSTRSASGDRVEFFVSNLLFGHDSGSGSTKIIAFPPSSRNNGGWYDINGINRARVYHSGSPERSSLMRFSIKGVRINDNVYSINESTGAGTLYTGSFTYDNNNQFDIIAGDITKPGNQFISPTAPVLPMKSIPNMREVKEFILKVDESKLHTDGVLEANWWECFSFVVVN